MICNVLACYYLLQLQKTSEFRYKIKCQLKLNLRVKIRITSTSTCDLMRQSASFKLIRDAKVLNWDEATMQRRWSMESVDSTLWNLLDNEEPLILVAKWWFSVVVFGKLRQLYLAPDAHISCRKRWHWASCETSSNHSSLPSTSVSIEIQIRLRNVNNNDLNSSCSISQTECIQTLSRPSHFLTRSTARSKLRTRSSNPFLRS